MTNTLHDSFDDARDRYMEAGGDTERIDALFDMVNVLFNMVNVAANRASGIDERTQGLIRDEFDPCSLLERLIWKPNFHILRLWLAFEVVMTHFRQNLQGRPSSRREVWQPGMARRAVAASET